MPGKNNTKLIVFSIVLAALTGVALVVGVAVLPFALQMRREAAQRERTREALRQVGEALRNYRTPKQGSPPNVSVPIAASASNADHRTPFPWLGMSVRADAGKLLVCNLDAAGIAYRQRLREGDVLLRVNRVNTSGMSLLELSQVVAQEASRGLKFTVKRGDQTREFVLTPPETKAEERK
jgi:C-terminal processing protease CtpA/Prc